MPKGHLFVGDALGNREDAFLVPRKFCRDFSGVTSLKEFADNEKSTFLAKRLALRTRSSLSASFNIQSLADDLLAAGLTVDETMGGLFLQVAQHGVPIMLVSANGCFLEAIEYDSSADAFKVTCKCKHKKDNANGLVCGNAYAYCEAAEKSKSSIHEDVKNIVINDLPTIGVSKEKGALPVFKFSTFLEFVIWRSHLGVHIEKALVMKAITEALSREALERLKNNKENLS